MKIGEFSRKYQVPQPTLRYYAERGLLIPEVKNRQYVFNGDCETDMKLIARLKAADFSLQEIHEILSLYRISNFASAKDVEQLLQYWVKRREQLQTERQQIRERLCTIDAMIEAVKADLERGSSHENT